MSNVLILGANGRVVTGAVERPTSSAFSTAHRVVLILVFTAFVAGCALNRSNVKSLRDRDASRIRLDSVIETTVAALNAIPPHCGPAADHRVRQEEFHAYAVVGRIARAKRERDHDIHIVLEDPENPRARLVVESADPDFRGNLNSPYRDRLAVARRMFDELVRQAGARQLNDLRGLVVRVTGVGFFDLNHFQIGRSRSCIELHPMLAIERVRDYSAEQGQRSVVGVGSLDIVVVTAATIAVKPLADCSEDDYERIFNINAKGTFFILKETAKRIKDGGRIIVFSTGGTRMFFPDQSLYLGSKGAVEQFVRCLSWELGTRGVTVNAISPGPTDTDMMQVRYRDRADAMSPLNRIGDPREVAEVALFLASDEARWVTGQNIAAGGGAS